jgi:hypothetical protein
LRCRRALWVHDDSVRTFRVVLVVAAALAVLSALAFALTPASGTFDSESYTCGTAFHFDSQGYEGAPGFAACDEERKSRRVPAIGLLALSGLICRIVCASLPADLPLMCAQMPI